MPFSASARRPSRSDEASLNTTPARCAKWLRPTPAVHAMSASIASSSSSSHERYRLPRSRSASSDFPDSGRRRVWRGWTCCSGSGRSPMVAGSEIATDFPEPADVPSGARYSSNTMWAFVPDIPKELTPASRGRPGRCGKSIIDDVTCNGRRSQSRLGLGFWKWRCFGITPRFSTSAALINPATPAADSRWPTLVFTEPMRSGRSAARPFP